MKRTQGFIERLSGFWRGGLVIEIREDRGRRIMNMCHYKGITLSFVSFCSESSKKRAKSQGEDEEGCDRVSCYVSLPDFYRLMPLFSKTGVRFHIIEKRGVPFIMNNLLRKKSSVAGFFSFFIFLWLFSSFVWDIRIEGQEKHSFEELSGYLKSIEVMKGMPVKNVDCYELEKKLRREYADIGWVSAQLDGSVLTVKLVEVHEETKVKEYKERHLIAQADGKVVYILTRHGTPLVKKGDMVSRGAILVSGVVEIKQEDMTVVSKYAVAADADIMLERTYKYKDSFSMSYKKKISTGVKKEVYGIGVNEKFFYITVPDISFPPKKQHGYYSFESEKELTHSFFLPLTFLKKEYLEYVEKEAGYTENEAKRLAKERLSDFLEKFQKKGVLIIKNNVTIKIENGVCKSSGEILVHEPVTTSKRVKAKEWRIETENGNKRDDT